MPICHPYNLFFCRFANKSNTSTKLMNQWHITKWKGKLYMILSWIIDIKCIVRSTSWYHASVGFFALRHNFSCKTWVGIWGWGWGVGCRWWKAGCEVFNRSHMGPLRCHFVKSVSLLSRWNVEFWIKVTPAVDCFTEVLFQGGVVLAIVNSFHVNTVQCAGIILLSEVNKY